MQIANEELQIVPNSPKYFIKHTKCLYRKIKKILFKLVTVVVLSTPVLSCIDTADKTKDVVKKQWKPWKKLVKILKKMGKMPSVKLKKEVEDIIEGTKKLGVETKKAAEKVGGTIKETPKSG